MQNEANSEQPPETTQPESVGRPQQRLLNPYLAIRNNPYWQRFSIDCDGRDLNVIKSVLVRHGAPHTVINLFVKSLSTYVRHNNLTLADNARLEQHIIDCADALEHGIGKLFEREARKQVIDNAINAGSTRPTPSGPDSQRNLGQEPSGDERRGVENLRSNSQEQTDVKPLGAGEQTTEASRPVKSGRGRKGK